ECRPDLMTHEVVVTVEAAAAGGIGCVQPLSADHHQDDVAFLDRAVDARIERGTWREVGDIVEHGVLAEVVDERIAEATSPSAGVGSAIAEEDPHGSRPRSGTFGAMLADTIEELRTVALAADDASGHFPAMYA